MRKITVVVLIVLLAVFIFFGCDGYNGVMYKHLSDPVNYAQYEVTVGKILYSNSSNTLCEYTPGDTGIVSSDKVVLEVYLATDEEAGVFYGVDSKPCDVYPVQLEINQANHKLLIENGFYDVVSKGIKLSAKTSHLIYMDSNFFYLCAITYNGTEYLNESDGISNIIAMMEKDRSLF